MRRTSNRLRVPVLAAGLGLALLAGCGGQGQGDPTPTSSTTGATSPSAASTPGLRTLAPRGVVVGTALSDQADALGDDAYRRILADNFSSVTPENQFKWRSTEAVRGSIDYGAADQAVQIAEQNHQAVRGHTLLWYGGLPDWVAPAISTCDSARTLLHDHIIDEVGHFRGRVAQWDVANEVFTPQGTLRQDNPFLKVCGEGIIGDAFRWAHVADPAAKLYLNDDGQLGSGVKSDAQYRLVRRLRQQGVPIDGVGFQAHLTLTGLPAGAKATLQRLAGLGVDVAITEADVRIPTSTTGPSDIDLRHQAMVYAQLVRLCLDQPRCTGFTVWGFADRWSWEIGRAHV